VVSQLSSQIRHFSSIDDFIHEHDKFFSISPKNQESLDTLDSEVQSSYAKHSFSKLFYFLSNHFETSIISEFGVLGCYSIISMSLGAAEKNTSDVITGYDLFEDYQFNSFAYDDAINRVKKFNLSNSINFIKCNALEGNLIEERLLKSDLTHIDLSNEGNLFERVLKAEFQKNSIVVLEGGSTDRDKNSWINKYDARMIYPVLKLYAKKRADIKISIIDIFPSVTIIQN
jgi:hypothetical protein